MKDAGQEPGCDRCGAPDAAELGDLHLCPDCFQLAGSSCGGGGVRREAAVPGPGGAGNGMGAVETAGPGEGC